MSFLKTLAQVELKDAAALGGVGVSLLFNAINYFRTNKVRSDSLRLDEFKRLRSPVDAACVAIRDHRNSLKSLEASGSSVAKVRKAVIDCNKALSESYNSLCDALADLDRSKFVHGSDWTTGVSDAWEQIVEAFDRTYVREKDLPAVKEAIRKIIIKIDDLLTLLHKRLDSEIV